MPMNNRILRPLAVPGVLDFAPGAAAAYSLRQLSNSYAGPVVTVRRSTDNAEADFTASEVSDGTLAGWAAADGFVKTWWDQSGNARHATASGTAQPQIVDSGVLVTEGGKAAVRFDGTDDGLSLSSPVSIGSGVDKAFSAFAAHRSNNASATQYLWHAGSGGGSSLIDHGLLIEPSVGQIFGIGPSGATNTWTPAIAPATEVFELLAAMFIASSSSAGNKIAYINGSQRLSLAYDGKGDAALAMNIGRSVGGATLAYSGKIVELLFYPTDMTALRTRIEGNLAWYY